MGLTTPLTPGLLRLDAGGETWACLLAGVLAFLPWLPLTLAGLSYAFPTESKAGHDCSPVPSSCDSPSEEGHWLVANEHYCSAPITWQNSTGEPSACPCWETLLISEVWGFFFL